MEFFQVIMIMVAILQPVAIGLLGWALAKLNKLDREVGEQSVGIANIIDQIREKFKDTARQLDTKKDKE